MNKILCVDDDPVTLMFCKSIIKKNYFAIEIDTAMDGQEAIDYYKSLSKSLNAENTSYPDLIFLDLNMPIMNGWEFLDEFVKSYHFIFPKTKVVILTSSIDPKDEEKANIYSIAIAFFSKPLTNEMIQELKKHFNQI